MASPARKPSRPGIVQEFELVPITDPIKQAALDRLRRGRSTKQDRRLLSKAGSKPRVKGRRRKNDEAADGNSCRDGRLTTNPPKNRCRAFDARRQVVTIPSTSLMHPIP